MGRRARTRRGRAATAAAASCLAIAALLGTAACSTAAAPEVRSPASVGSPSARARDAELSRFTRIAAAVARKHHAAGGMDFVRALERAGYRRSALQVTADRTSVGLRVPAVQFAARSGDSCLIGQYGDAGLQVLRADPVDGACLVGGTRSLG